MDDLDSRVIREVTLEPDDFAKTIFTNPQPPGTVPFTGEGCECAHDLHCLLVELLVAGFKLLMKTDRIDISQVSHGVIGVLSSGFLSIDINLNIVLLPANGDAPTVIVGGGEPSEDEARLDHWILNLAYPYGTYRIWFSTKDYNG
jgi:hypothetical protein